VIFRRWAAITTLGAVLEQKVWGYTVDKIYPNMYTFLVGHPGVGKTRTINAAKKLCETLEDFFLAPQGLTMASLVDALKASKRTVTNPALGLSEEFNSMALFSDDWQVTMSDWKNDLVAGLTTFYDIVTYAEMKRTKSLNIKLHAPQLSILAGSTPSQLMTTMKPEVWEQGFTSRSMFIFSDQHKINSTAFGKQESNPNDLIHDLHYIHSLWGQLGNSEEFISRIDNWRTGGMPPCPSHPRLLHYNSRRFVHLFKLCIIACVDRGQELVISEDDFARALKWLLEAEMFMPNLFQSGAGGTDIKAMEEILHFIKEKGAASQGELVRFATNYVPSFAAERLIQTMEMSNMIKRIGNHPRYGTPVFAPDQA
jgi:hypothetical protein